MQYPLLTEILNSSKTLAVPDWSPELIAEIKSALSKYRSPIDDSNLVEVFNDFKVSQHLGYPDQVGGTTAQHLLDFAGVPHRTAKLDTAQPTLGKSVVWFGTTYHERQEVIPGTYLTWGEVTKGLTREPENPDVIVAVRRVAKTFGRIRECFGSPIVIKSGYRPPYINRSVGGAKFSRHVVGDALDIAPLNGDFQGLLRCIMENHKTGGFGDGVSSGDDYYHIDCRPSNVLTKWNYGG